MASFNKGMQDFGDGMNKVTKELSEDMKQSNKNTKAQSSKR